MNAPSLRARLLGSLLAIFLVAEIATGLVTYRSVLRESQQLFDYHLVQMALSLRDQGALLAPSLPPDEREKFDFVVQIWDADGSRLYFSQTRTTTRPPARGAPGFADVIAEGQRWRVYTTVTRGRVIQVSQPAETRERIAAAAALRSLLPLALIAPLAGLAIWWLVGRTLAPLRRVSDELRDRDVGRMDPIRGESGLPSEVAPMIAAINALLQRLRNAFDAQRNFVADAAHELRTPLAAVRLQAGLIERARNDDERSQALAQLRAGVERSSRLVDQMLTLARSEAEAATAAGARTDLVAVAAAVTARMQALAAERGRELRCTADVQPLYVGTDEQRLESLLQNLIDNALRHVPQGRRIELTLRRDGLWATLLVDDDGPGLPEMERARAFDRFRGRTAGAHTGSGLGLAIVRSVAERSGGSVQLSDSPLGGLRVTVQLPLALAPTAPSACYTV